LSLELVDGFLEAAAVEAGLATTVVVLLAATDDFAGSVTNNLFPFFESELELELDGLAAAGVLAAGVLVEELLELLELLPPPLDGVLSGLEAELSVLVP